MTSDQIEAAALVIWYNFNDARWQNTTPETRNVYLHIARTALTAAARTKSVPAPPTPKRGRERYSDWILPAHN